MPIRLPFCEPASSEFSAASPIPQLKLQLPEQPFCSALRLTT